MSDTDANTNNDEKLQLKENLDTADNVNADVDLDDSKAKFINGDADHVQVQVPSSDTASFTGLGKEDLMKYATDPFWIRLRWILFILFWVGWAAMLAAAIIIIVLAPRCPYRPDLKWYNKDATYQVHVESFKDSNGDGVGDLKGLKSKIDYIEKLGVKSIWLSSIFKSDNIDGGNGVIDYKDVNPKIGTLDDLVSLGKDLFKRDMRLIIDIIPNHTSRNHTWFQKSQRGEVGFEEFYVWADQDNGWKNANGRSIWTMDTVRNKYYLHQVGEEFPDLNLRNEDVMKEMEEILRFWVSKGVYGFNVVGAQYLTENENLTAQAVGSNDQTINFPDNLDIIQQWREILDSLSTKPGREKLLMASFPTMYDRNDTLDYFGDETKGFNVITSELFTELDQTCDATCLDREISSEVGSVELVGWRGWLFGSQNKARAGSRFPGLLGKLMNTVQMLLPGTGYVYYGDEIGMTNGNTNANPPVDSYRAVNGGTIRDMFRTPMQWDNTPTAGFTNSTPYIPLSGNHAIVNVKTEEAHKLDGGYNSLDLLKDLISLRQEESFQFGKLSTKVSNNVLLIHRAAVGFPAYLVAANFDPTAHSISMFAGEGGSVPSKVMVVLRTNKKPTDKEIDIKDQLFTIPPHTAIVLKYVE